MDQERTVEISRFKITAGMAEAIEQGRQKLAGVSRNDWLRMAAQKMLEVQGIKIKD